MEAMTPFEVRYLKVKAKLQTRAFMHRHRCKPWWNLALWTEAEMRFAWGDR